METTDSSVQERCLSERATLAALQQVLREALAEADLPVALVPDQPHSFNLERDPADGRLTLVGTWRSERAQPLGGLVIHSGGQVFAELYVQCPWPRDPKLDVDAVVAFGTRESLHAELRFAPRIE